MAKKPHERSLVTRRADKAFILIGVNIDEDREIVKADCERMQITWPQFFDRLNGLSICKTWSVEAIPTTFVIDPQGTIRYKNISGKELDTAVDKLLAEDKPQ